MFTTRASWFRGIGSLVLGLFLASGAPPLRAAGPAPPTPAPAAAPKAGSPLATADGEKPGIRAEVTELKRGSAGTLQLKFTIVNDSAKKMDFSYDFGDPDNHIKDFDSIGGVTLLDPVGKKKYFVVRDSEKACVCSRGLKGIDANSRANVWAKFPAPPENVKQISVVIPHFGPMDDVPISQ